MTRVTGPVVLLLFGALACFADVVEVEGVIKSVDAAKRSVVIGKKTIEVPKKCRITVNGEEASLSDLKPDQKVVVEYDDELEIAKSITVGEGPSGDDVVGRDMKALQGEWEAVEAELGGVRLDKSAVRKLNRLVTIKGNSYKEERLVNGKVTGVEGKFEINPKNKGFDFIGKVSGTNNAFTYVGIYEIKDDTLKLCLRVNADGNAVRPKSFKSDSQKVNWSHYYTYKRIEK